MTKTKVSPITLCQEMQRTLDQHKAVDLTVIDLEGKSSLGDFMVIATGTSLRHLHSLAEYAQQRAKELGIKNTSLEGGNTSGWVILDLKDVIIHLFLKDARALYDLESMWDPKLYRRVVDDA